MIIDTTDKLRSHLKVLKFKLLKDDFDPFQLYPTFCIYYAEHKERYLLPKEEVLDLACEILIEEA